MLQYIYDFLITYFSLESATPETQAFLNLVIVLGSVIFACCMLYFMFWIVKTVFMMIFRGGK